MLRRLGGGGEKGVPCCCSRARLQQASNVSGKGRLPLPLAGAGMNLPHHVQAAARWLRLLTVGAAAGRGAQPRTVRWELGLEGGD